MENKIIEFGMQTGWEWFVQGIAIFFMLIGLVLCVGIIVLICRGIHALNIYIKKNK